MTPIARYAPAARVAAPSASVAGLGTTTEFAQYRSQVWRPAGLRLPITVPNVSPRG